MAWQLADYFGGERAQMFVLRDIVLLCIPHVPISIEILDCSIIFYFSEVGWLAT